jgi:hypothetical protein
MPIYRVAPRRTVSQTASRASHSGQPSRVVVAVRRSSFVVFDCDFVDEPLSGNTITEPTRPPASSIPASVIRSRGCGPPAGMF